MQWDDLNFADEGILLKIRYSKTDRAGIGATKLLPKLDEQAVCPVFYYSKYRDTVADKTGRFFFISRR